MASYLWHISYGILVYEGREQRELDRVLDIGRNDGDDTAGLELVEGLGWQLDLP